MPELLGPAPVIDVAAEAVADVGSGAGGDGVGAFDEAEARGETSED